jgi:hypothetical protein
VSAANTLLVFSVENMPLANTVEILVTYPVLCETVPDRQLKLNILMPSFLIKALTVKADFSNIKAFVLEHQLKIIIILQSAGVCVGN